MAAVLIAQKGTNGRIKKAAVVAVITAVIVGIGLPGRAYAEDPVAIDSVTPGVVGAGGSIAITGHGFSTVAAENTVRVNGFAATVTSGDSTSLVATVPAGATSGPVTVLSPLGSAVSVADVYLPPSPFTVADVESVQRLSFGVAATAAVATASKISLLTVSGPTGHRLSLRLSGSTFGSSTSSAKVAVYLPDGTALFSPTGFGSSGLFIEPLAQTADGTYQVLIDPQGTAIGQVTVTAYDVPANGAETTAAGGSPLTVATTVPGQNAVVSFSGAAGQRVYFAFSGGTFGASANAQVSVRKPDGSTLYSPISCGTSCSFDTTTLPVAGTYTILLDPQTTSIGALTVQLYDVLTDVADTAAVGGSPLTVATSVPGQNAVVSFSGAAGQRVYFAFSGGTFGASANARVSVRKPDGSTLYSPISCGISCAFDTTTLTVSGTYTIVFDPQTTLAGELTIQLYDVPADATVAVAIGGPAVALATTVPGVNGTFTFSGTAGQRVFFALSAGTFGANTNATVAVRKPDGTSLVNAMSCGVSCIIDTKTLSVGGLYTIVLDPSGAATGSLTAQLYDVTSDATATIVPDGPAVTLAIDAPGRNGVYSFTGALNQRIFFAFSAGTFGASTNATVAVRQPDGTSLVGALNCGVSCTIDTKAMPVAGTYTILLDPSSSRTGSLTAQLYDVPDDPVTVTTIGAPAVVAATATPGQNGKVTFSGTAGQRISIQLSGSTYGTSTSNVSVTTLNPDGSTLIGSTGVGSSTVLLGPVTLPATGDYTLALNPAGANVGGIAVRAYDVGDATATTTVGGGPVTVNTTIPGQNASVTFPATAGNRVAIQISNSTYGSSTGSMSATVLNPDGTTLVASSGVGSGGLFIDARTLSATGTYTILLDPSGSLTGSVQVQVLAIPADTMATVGLDGIPVTAANTTPGQNMAVRFDGQAGQRISLGFASSTGSIYGTVLAPDGSTLKARWFIFSNSFVEPLTLTTTGTYTVLLDPSGATLGSIPVRAWAVPADQAYPAAVGGAATTVTTTIPGENATVTFIGTAGQRVSVKFSNGTNNVYATIKRADGTDLKARWFVGISDFVDPLTLPVGGTYTIVVDPDEDRVGSVTVQLYDVPTDITATTDLGGARVAVDSAPPGQKATITFPAAAGVRVFVVLDDIQMDSGSVVTYLRNASGTSLGSVVYYATPSNDTVALGPIEVTANGTYSVVVDPDDDAVGSFRVRVLDATPPPVVPAAVGGPAATFATTVPGQVAEASFTGMAGQRISIAATGSGFFDGVKRVWFSVQLRNTAGATLASRSGGDVDDTVLVPATTLPANGTYTVRLDPAAFGVGTMDVQIFAVPADTAITASLSGGPFLVDLPVPGMAAVVTFTAGDGDAIDVASLSGAGVLDATVTDEGGSEICGSTLEPDGIVYCTDDADAGSYQLRVTAAEVASGTWRLELFNGIGTPQIFVNGLSDPQTWLSSPVTASWETPSLSPISGYAVAIDTQPATDPGTTVSQPGPSWSGPIADGVYFLHVRAIGNGGRSGPIADRMLKVDSTAPTLASAVVTSHPDPAVAVATLNVTAQFASQTDLSGVTYAVSVTHGTDDIPLGPGTSGVSFVTTVPSEGHWYLHVVAVDGAGNRSGALHREFLADLPPTAPVITSSTHPVPGTAYPYQDFLAQWRGTEATGQSWAVVLDHTPGTAPSVAIASVETRFGAHLAAGTWWLHVRGVDAAGTAGATAHFQIVVDPAPVGFTAPANAAAVWNSVALQLSCPAGTPSLTIQARLAGGSWQDLGAAAPAAGVCALTWDTTTWPDGATEIRALDGPAVVAGLSVDVENDTNVVERLTFAYQAGAINAADYVRFGLFGLTDPDSVPAAYRDGATAVGDLDAARQALLTLWQGLPADVQAEIAAAMTPVPDEPGALRSTPQVGALDADYTDCDFGTHIFNKHFSCRVEIDHFTIYYSESDLSGPRQPTGRYTYIQDLMSGLQSARSLYANDLHYLVPDHVDVIVAPLPAGSGISLPALPFCGCGDGTMLIDNNAFYVTGVGAHETFHFVQYQYMWDNHVIDYWMSWWMEATAEWAAHQISGQTGADRRYYDDLVDFLAVADERFDEGNTPASEGGPEYGAFIVAEFLQDRIGTPDVIRWSWERLGGDFPPRPGAVIKELIEQKRVGGNFAEEIQRLREWTYVVDAGTSGVGFHDPDAPNWKQEAIRQHSEGPNLVDGRPPQDTVTITASGPGATGSAGRTVDVQQTGAYYVEIKNPEGWDAEATVSFDSADPDMWGSVVRLKSDGTPAYECGDATAIWTSADIQLTAACPGAFITLVNTEEAGWYGTEADVAYHIDYKVDGLTLGNGFVEIGVDTYGHIHSNYESPIGVRLSGQPDTDWLDNVSGEGWGVGVPSVYESTGWTATPYFPYRLNLVGLQRLDNGQALSSSTATIGGNIEVTHRFERALPSLVCPPGGIPGCPKASRYLYKITVNVTNHGGAVPELHYRRIADWHVDYSNEANVTLQHRTASVPSYYYGANVRDGCEVPDPTRPDDLIEWITDQVHSGCTTVELDLGGFGAGQTKYFTVYYGVAPDAATAMAAVNDVNAEVYSLAKPPNGSANGSPATGILAFDGRSLA